MPRRSRRRLSATNWFAPVLVALVMGGVAFAVSDGGQSMFDGPAAPGGVATSTEEIPAQATTDRFEIAVRAPTADRDQRYTVDPASKTIMPVEVPKGWRVEALNDTSGGLRLESSEDRGFKITDGGEWNVPLRSPTGEAYSEPRILGRFDERHAAVVARTDRLRVLKVSRAGLVSVLGNVPEYANVLGLSGGSVWIATFTPGEGLESEPTGPSSLIRIDASGKEEIETGSKEDVFAGVLADQGRVAFWMENSGLFTGDAPGEFGFSGSGIPLLWMDGRLLVAHGSRLQLYGSTPNGSEPQDLGLSLPGTPSAARLLD